ncbi:MAG: hypothetical protein COA45_03855 [Zetaproteobacteria bacterium]|nr:MAG: hypothetical protein COA45_03855 [Zetaproteobacteria bacterium]
MTELRKLKVIFLLPALTSGGAERVLITLMNNIDRTRFEPHLLCISDHGSIGGLIDKDLPFHSLYTRSVLRSTPKLYAKLRTIEPDIIVSTMVHVNFVLLMLQPFFPRTKFIVREAITPSFVFTQHPRIAPILKLAYKYLYRKADVVLSPAQAIIDEFKQDLHMACENHSVLHNPVDIEFIRGFPPTPPSAPSTRAQTVHFVAGGRLHKQKGYDRLIRALPSLNMPHEWTLTIFGKGPERGALRQLIQETGLQNHVKLAGHTQSPWPHYAQADCFLMPSRWEGLPNAVLESLACGTPTIVTAQSGGIAEIQDITGTQHVRIAQDMDEFIQLMSKVTPSPSPIYRPSLLPDYFSKDFVVARFEKILTRVI